MVFLSTSTQIFERHIKTGKDHVLPAQHSQSSHFKKPNQTVDKLQQTTKLHPYIFPPPISLFHWNFPYTGSFVCSSSSSLLPSFFLLFLQSFTLYLSHQYCCHSGIPDSLAMLAQQKRVLGRQPAQTMNAAWYIVRSVIVFSHFKQAS